MSPQEILERLTSKFPDPAFGIEAKLDAQVDPFIKVSPQHIIEIAQFLRDDDELQFDFLSSLSGIDLKGKLGVVYHLFSIAKRHKITLRVEVPTDAAEVQSVESIWKTANWHEREAFDLFGIRFAGHPDMRRILLPYDWEGYPLRKDYQVPEFYNGMRVPY
ncbi:MAG: NADH-quinone oxidoreductase subunit C [Bacteroidota bacterium]|nr:NADH-quinone oxidoreductase subunit C [Bacteroidota bacterium]